MADLVTIGTPPWTPDSLRAGLEEFTTLYERRPIHENAGGMAAPHMFLAWSALRALRPRVIVESGVWMGQGTWLLEQACPDAELICIEPFPSTIRYRSARATYLTRDFTEIDWSGVPREETVLFFDDHQNAFDRVAFAAGLGFRHLIFEDNYPSGQGDCYSLKKAFASSGFRPPRRPTVSWGARLRRSLMQFAARERTGRDVVPNSADAFSLRENLEVYAELPPVCRSETTRWGDAWSDASYPTLPPLLDRIDSPSQQVFLDEAATYTWMCYARLKDPREPSGGGIGDRRGFEVVTASRITRRAPANLAPGDESLFAREMSREIPPARLDLLRDVTVDGRGRIARGGRILGESYLEPWLPPLDRSGGLAFRLSRRLPHGTLPSERPGLWVTDGWSGGYFHWMTDALPRLVVALEHVREPILLLPASLQSHEFVGATLAALGVTGTRFVTRREVLRVPELVVPSHTAPTGNYNEEVIRSLASRLAVTVMSDSAVGGRRRIFVSRSGARRRRLENEAEILSVLAPLGFELVRFEELSWREQVHLCAGAEFVVSMHGAGLTNMLFLPAAASVLEIRRRADDRNNCYFSLASALGLKYFYSLGDPAPTAPSSDDLHVDPVALLRDVLRMLEGSHEPDMPMEAHAG
jgi:hypothetical protein